MPENPIQKQERAKRDKEILELYPLLTMQEIGDKYGLVRERVRQILQKAGVKIIKT